MSLLGVDLGTSGIRVVGYGTDGRELATRERPLHLTQPAPGRAELDAIEIQHAVEQVVREIGTTRELAADPVAALSFSVLGEAVVPTDRVGSPTGPVIVSMDERGAPALERFRRSMPEVEYHAITGQPLHPMFSAFKIAAEERPWRTATRYLCMGDYLTQAWTGEAVIDYGMAARTGLFDVDRLVWSDGILNRLQEFAPWLDEARLPRVGPSGQAVGHVLPAVAERLGLPATAVVALGTHDQAAALLGCGGPTGARSSLSFGSSDCLTVATSARPSGFVRTGLASYPIDDSTWITLAGTAAGGWALDWFARLTGQSVEAAFDELSPEPPPLLVVPYLRGSGTLDNDPAATGTVHGLTLDTTVPQLARAFVEASGLEFARIADAFTQRRVDLGELAVSGGGARNRPALLARANALGRPLAIAPDNAAARGAARLAARSLGIEDAFAAPPHAAPPVRPEPQHADWYAAQRRNYLALVEATRRLRPPMLTEPNT